MGEYSRYLREAVLNEIVRILSTNVKKIRELHGYSQIKFAERCDLSQSYIGDIEIGKKYPSADSLAKIANALGVEPYELFRKTHDSEGWNRVLSLARMRSVLKTRLNDVIDATLDDRKLTEK